MVACITWRGHHEALGVLGKAMQKEANVGHRHAQVIEGQLWWCRTHSSRLILALLLLLLLMTPAEGGKASPTNSLPRGSGGRSWYLVVGSSRGGGS
jgi:hypothetical protein